MTYFIEPENPRVGYSKDANKCHDAGFDAYMTSSVFVNLCNLYGEFYYIYIYTRVYIIY